MVQGEAAVRRKFASPYGDHFTMLNVYKAWRAHKVLVL
jgi:hypothetical protein